MDSASLIDESIFEMCEIIAKAKGWTLEKTAKVLQENTLSFLKSQT